ncbi:hypothetical protein [Actinoalloteichus sp. GBA129-24]|uniref:hypothetical protein n=1 Tax=Actinoalloteichus sp. GBA129-24 TaxID=1612551 RepID=UPI0009505162|nr:hypothetical protein [Actinoalloteichus sp. GBA129-24]APU18753.1 hypothetical protein UA75_03600 [Actinoalloteichus sp. GBA129-24]
MTGMLTANSWFVRSVRMGDTHLGRIEVRASAVVVWPACGLRRFVALNRWPIDECYYDDQPCADCLATLGPTAGPMPPSVAWSVSADLLGDDAPPASAATAVPTVTESASPRAVVPAPRRVLAVVR